MKIFGAHIVRRCARSVVEMRGEALRLQTVLFQLSTRLYIVHQSPYPDVGVGHPLRYPRRSDSSLLYLDVSAQRYLNTNR